MSLTNILLTFVVIVLAGAGVAYFVKRNKNAEVEEEIEKDGDQILIAELQTAGIGTKGRRWHTGENKNIAMTIISHPKCKISELEGITIKIAENIQQIIEEMYGEFIQIMKHTAEIYNK